jgi:hypothetical protein
MKNAILGYSGFVGTHLCDRIEDCDLYNSKNIKDIHGKSYDTIYCAWLPAVKWKANRDTIQAIIYEIMSHLDKISSCNKIVKILIRYLFVFRKH